MTINRVDLIIEILGLPLNDELLGARFAELEVDIEKDVDLSSDDFRVYVEKPNQGFSLILTDEAHHRNIPTQSIGVGRKYFTGAFLYSEGRDGYSEFSDDLPNGLSFNDSRDVVIRLLGEPEWSRFRKDKSVVSDRWHIDFYKLTVTYSKNHESISLLSIVKPDVE